MKNYLHAYFLSDGRPNASIRLLVSMMIIKEGYKYSYFSLFAQNYESLGLGN
ncbi:hypothetical protein WDW89_25170 [Deltaproteobacteria bacterium TL4]